MFYDFVLGFVTHMCCFKQHFSLVLVPWLNFIDQRGHLIQVYQGVNFWCKCSKILVILFCLFVCVEA